MGEWQISLKEMEIKMKEFELKLGDLTDDEREIILKGCLINYYKA